MFEGRIFGTGQDAAASQAGNTAESARELSWGELVARLGAAQDFRRLIEVRQRAGGGSFDASSARCLAGHGGRQPTINPNGLVKRKIASGNVAQEVAHDTIGDRGR